MPEDFESDQPSNVVYCPSPEEIRRECEKYQVGWSDKEREKRDPGGQKRWTVPVAKGPPGSDY